MGLFILALIIFFAVFTQALTGFGLALVSMPLLVERMGIQVAAPLVALVGIVSQIVLLIRYRESISIGDVKQLAVGSVIGIPLGVLALRQVDETAVTTLLGVILIAYSLYALISPELPELRRTFWAYGLGLVSGLLTGAYNTGGPALVLYGSSQQWPPQEFKGNLQSLLIIHSGTVITAHAVAGNFTYSVWEGFLAAVPAIALGTVAGFALDRFLNPSLFRKLVLVLLLILGIRLVM